MCNAQTRRGLASDAAQVKDEYAIVAATMVAVYKSHFYR